MEVIFEFCLSMCLAIYPQCSSCCKELTGHSAHMMTQSELSEAAPIRAFSYYAQALLVEKQCNLSCLHR